MSVFVGTDAPLVGPKAGGGAPKASGGAAPKTGGGGKPKVNGAAPSTGTPGGIAKMGLEHCKKHPDTTVCKKIALKMQTMA
jgi:hypothetical protein